MIPKCLSEPPSWVHPLSPALVTDLPVLAGLVLCWLTIPVFWAHLATGLALIVLIGVHLRTRRRRVLSGRTRHRFGYGLLLLAATAMSATGLLRWAGVPPQQVWHGGISYLLLGLVVVHLWVVRRALRARTRRPRTRRTGVRQEESAR